MVVTHKYISPWGVSSEFLCATQAPIRVSKWDTVRRFITTGKEVMK